MNAATATRRQPAPLAVALLTFLLVSAAATHAQAHEPLTATIAFADGTYHYTFGTVVDAPLSAVRAIVTDYEHQQRLNDSITESRVLARFADGSLKRLLRLEQCVVGICFTLNYVEMVVEEDKLVTTTIVPGEGNFRDGVVRWQFDAQPDGRTRVTVDARQTPDFWIPPVIGPWVLERVYRREVRETCDNITRLLATESKR